MTDTPRRAMRDVAIASSWRPGTDLEDWAAVQLARWGQRPDHVAQQHRVGRYRLDFAWPAHMVALELDGWHHRSPESAARDALRDASLRARGWLVFRVDDRGTVDERTHQLLRVVEVVSALQRMAARAV